MSKYAAITSAFNVGVRQVETATVVGTVDVAGNIHVVCTSAQIAGSPLQTVVAVLHGDTADTVATKIRTALNLVAAITLNFVVGGSGAQVTLTRKAAAANEVALNIDYHQDGGTTGLVDDLTSDDTTAGVALTAVAQVKKIGGPGLSVDTDDVTCHDSTGGWEEVVPTILRSGECSLDIVYDPGLAIHAATSGLLARLKNKTQCQFSLVFPGPYTWTFDGYCSKFEPSADVGAALTASVTVKINSVPTLV